MAHAGRHLVAARSLWRRHPESPVIASMYFDELVREALWDSVAFRAERLATTGVHPLLTARGHQYSVMALHALGRHQDETAAVRRAAAFGTTAPLQVREYLSVSLAASAHAPSAGGVETSRDDSLRAVANARLLQVLPSAHPDVVGTRLGEAEAALDRGDLARSLVRWNALASLADSLALPSLQARVYMRRGRTRVKLGDWEAAERDLLAARGFAARQGFLSNAYEVEHNLLHLYEAQGRDDEARRAGEAFVILAGEGGLEQVRMMSHRDLAWFLRRRGAHDEARRHFEAMVADLDSLDDRTHALAFFAGEYYELIGDLDRAVPYYARAALQPQPARALEALARVAETMGDLESAVGYARRHDQVRDDIRYNPEFRPLLPALLARSGRWAQARVELGRARTAAVERGQAAAWARLTLDLANLEYGRGRVAEAVAVADSAAVAAERVAEAGTAVRARALASLGRVVVGGRDERAGVAGLQRAARQARRMALPQLEADVLTMLGDALAHVGDIREALATFARAGVVSDAVARSLADDPASAGFRGATQRRVSNRALAGVVARAHGVRAPAWFAEWSGWRKSRGIRERAVAGSGDESSARPQSGGAGVAGDQAVIDFAVLDTTVAALVVTDRDSTLVVLPVTAESLEARVLAFHARIAPRVGGFVDVGRSRFDLPLARRLYTDLLGPLEPLLVGRTRLTIVPDAPLHLLPIDALVITGPDSNPEYVLDRYGVSVATSLDGAAAAPPNPEGLLVAVAGPETPGSALGTAREVADIVAAWTDRGVEVLAGSAATDAAVGAAAQRAAILHIASHARANERAPDHSSIALEAGPRSDGRLHAFEVRNLRLPGSLVVLSACETGTGRLAGGEGTLSLGRAFLQAGAGATVVTLWPVGGATRELMAAFYRQLAQGRTPPEALRSAKLTLRKASHRDPFHWAAFTLVGGSPPSGIPAPRNRRH
jgi:CHAT domain-containing protein/tetratricopeptide (TPR) repeat protein